MQRRTAEHALTREIDAVLGHLDVEPVANPLEALAQVAGEVLAWKELAAEKVAQLRSLDVVDVFGAQQVQAAVQVFERAMDRAVHVLGLIARLRIDERLSEISRAQGMALAEAMRGIADELRFTPEQRLDLPRALGRHLAVVRDTAS